MNATHPSAVEIVADLQDRLDRLATLCRAIRPWAETPEAGQPGREIVALLDTHERLAWLPADPVAQVRRVQARQRQVPWRTGVAS